MAKISQTINLHLTIFVRDLVRSRDWYTSVLGLEVQFEVDSPRAVTLQGSGGFTLFVEQRLDADFKPSCVITFRIDDVESFANALPAGKRTDVPLCANGHPLVFTRMPEPVAGNRLRRVPERLTG
jgi:catechol 2,3-dioxygenase-like lactoylglutathione lyase family enzyme